MFDNFEINLVGEFKDHKGKNICEVINEKDTYPNMINKFWTIYGHLPEGGCEALIDIEYEQKEYAYNLFRLLQKLLSDKKELLEVCQDLAHVINLDKDGDYFICKEAKEYIDNLYKIIAKAEGKEI